MGDDKAGLAGLLAFKSVCCGALLIALGGAGLGGATSPLAGNGWVQAGGYVLAALGLGWWLAQRRRATTRAIESDGAVKSRGAVPVRERDSVPAARMPADGALETGFAEAL